MAFPEPVRSFFTPSCPKPTHLDPIHPQNYMLSHICPTGFRSFSEITPARDPKQRFGGLSGRHLGSIWEASGSSWGLPGSSGGPRPGRLIFYCKNQYFSSRPPVLPRRESTRRHEVLIFTIENEATTPAGFPWGLYSSPPGPLQCKHCLGNIVV